ncbi:hypothetical protein [Nonomuraea sp. NPDC049129]|uniref:hypothetical protein n=1 Tax=Nonomuraea sp. NPDC049129 TaxID=3155272 RepID=UPI0033D9504E
MTVLAGHPDGSAGPGRWPVALRFSREWRCRAVADVGGQDSLVGLVDPVGGDHLDLAADTVLGAEVEHLLGQGDATDHRTGEDAPGAAEEEPVDGQRPRGGADADQGAVDGQQAQVGVDVDVGADGVDDEVEPAAAGRRW